MFKGNRCCVSSTYLFGHLETDLETMAAQSSPCFRLFLMEQQFAAPSGCLKQPMAATQRPTCYQHPSNELQAAALYLCMDVDSNLQHPYIGIELGPFWPCPSSIPMSGCCRPYRSSRCELLLLMK